MTTIHTDFLGSPVAETNASGTVTRVERYTPYGEPSDMQLDAGPGFTGHASDVATGLTNMQQRYMDQELGRFLTPDPVGPEEDFVEHFNRYSYVLNNPIRNIDPDGSRCNVSNWTSSYCTRRDVYRGFDISAKHATRFFGAASLTVEYLANQDMPIAGAFGPSGEAQKFLQEVSAKLFSLNTEVFKQILKGSLSTSGLDAKMVHMEQTEVQAMLDNLPKDMRTRIIDSINSSFARRNLAAFGPGAKSDARYNKVIDGVEKKLGRPIDFGNQSDREAIGNALIKDIRSSGACGKTGGNIKSC